MRMVGWLRSPFHDLWNQPRGQLPALDALRTLAVLLVVAEHGAGAHFQLTGIDNLFNSLVRGGWIGVDLFFVLSGYFIGRQLWRELQRTDSVQIGRFMLRRGLRIWPLYLFFLVFVLAVLGRGDFPFGRWWSDALFITNYHNRGVVMGSWSLCTEEQFYILAPLVLYLTARPGAGIARYRNWLIGLLVVLPLVRALTWLYHTGGFGHDTEVFAKHIYYQFHTHADGLVMGMLIAHVEMNAGDGSKRGPLSHGWVVALALAGGVLLQRVHREIFDFTALALLFGALTWYFVSRAGNLPWYLRFLEYKVFYIVSRLSYGMYLNNEYLTGPLAHAVRSVLPFGERYPSLLSMATATSVAVVSALLSVVTFALIEHPFLVMRGRLLGAQMAPPDKKAVLQQ
jgi:peptidoglycan/LPS O-acetylase OafA/YrhL